MPSTNGHSTESVRPLGGYDAYFAQPDAALAAPPRAGSGDPAAPVPAEPFQVPDAARLIAQSGAAAPHSVAPRSAAPQVTEAQVTEAPETPAGTATGLERRAPADDATGIAPAIGVSAGEAPAPRSAPESGHLRVRAELGTPEPDRPWTPPETRALDPAHVPESAPAYPNSDEPRAEIRRYTAPSRAQMAARRRGEYPAEPQRAEYAVAEPTPLVPERIERAAEPAARIEVLPTTLTSMDLLADIAAANRARLRSTTGVRGALNKVGFRLGLSPAEQRVEERRARIRRQLTSTYQIAVVSVKGGVGRTTTAAALGSTFAALRPDRVVAIDANPDFGDLATRTSRHPYGLTLRDLAQAPDLDAFSAVQSFTSINTADLAVLASPWTTEATEPLSGHEYTTTVEVLRRHFNLLLVDCGTGVLDAASATVLRASDAVVVVTPATVGGVTGAVATLNWLGAHGLGRLVASSIVAIVHHQPAKPTVEVEAIEQLFATAQRPTRVLPYDAHLAEGGEIDLRLLDGETAAAFEELAAELADGFPGHRPGDQGGWR
ncbi:AAA family ATPase [Nocardia asteroides]|uniref:nucleotide-binding protein n=1 Tax=Nocardia asteroides TaxID=1824 RepID=UPI001E32AD47|nr:AAA family ATPase [Nocardia asteroides]UGT63338.1 AAA family ATPase [Nocardia asteroides]